ILELRERREPVGRVDLEVLRSPFEGMAAPEAVRQIDPMAEQNSLFRPLHQWVERLRLRPGPESQRARRRGIVHAHERRTPGGRVTERSWRKRSPAAMPDIG